MPFKSLEFNGELLAKELFADLPSQVVRYISLINKPPGESTNLNIHEHKASLIHIHSFI